jgi:Tol biopolymer transport system component
VDPEGIPTLTFRQGGGTALLILDPARGESFEVLPRSAQVTDPAWSSDYELAYLSSPGEASGGDIDVVASDITEQAEPLTVFDGDASTGHVAWSPDGEQIVFVHRDSLWVLDVATGDVRELPVPASLLPAQPAWSPDGAWVAFTAVGGAGSETDLYAIPADGGEVAQLTDSAGREEFPVWSPDGNWIAFLSNQDFREDLWILRPDGSEIRRVTDSEARELAPTWSPG